MNFKAFIREIPRSERQYRSMGYLFAFLLVIKAFLQIKNASAELAILVWLFLAFFVYVLSRQKPSYFYWPYIVWMTMASVVGHFVSRLLLAIIFYVLLFPMGAIARALGERPLSPISRASKKSYWKKYDKNASQPRFIRNQF